MALMVALLAGLALTHAIRAWHIFVIAFLLGSFSAVAGTLRGGAVHVPVARTTAAPCIPVGTASHAASLRVCSGGDSLCGLVLRPGESTDDVGIDGEAAV
jgi:hypothetical protein